MSEPGELAGVEAAIRDLLPDLTERLERHGLGEIEVRHGDLRLRVTGSSLPAPAMAPESGAHPAQAPVTSSAGGGRAADPHQPSTHGVLAPAVGYFVFGDGLGPGLPVEKGDPLGYVDVLGVRHDVRAPRRGVVRNLVTETGEAVEYGQVLIELESAAP